MWVAVIFYPRLPHKLGFYLGLTGTRLIADDCVALGIAQQKVPQEILPNLLDALAKQAWGNQARTMVTSIIEKFTVPVIAANVTLQSSTPLTTCFSAPSIEEILSALQTSSAPECKTAVAALMKKSPTSLKVTLKALQQGAHLDFDRCMHQEYRLTKHFLSGHDFLEGIRAVIIDKDQKPRWSPDSLKAVTEDRVEKYFTQIGQELFN